MEELIVKNSIEIYAPVSKVWEILTKPEWTRQYMYGCEIISDWKIGGPLLWRGAADEKIYVVGNLMRIVPENLLEYTVFDPNAGLEDIPINYTTVTYELLDEDNGSILTITQGDFSRISNSERRYKDTLAGWKSVMPAIKRLAENG